MIEQSQIDVGNLIPLILDQSAAIGTTSANSVESDPGSTSMVYFVEVTLTSQKPCQHNNKCDCSKTNGHNIPQ